MNHSTKLFFCLRFPILWNLLIQKKVKCFGILFFPRKEKYTTGFEPVMSNIYSSKLMRLMRSTTPPCIQKKEKPPFGIEPKTVGLQNQCSTTELRKRKNWDFTCWRVFFLYKLVNLAVFSKRRLSCLLFLRRMKMLGWKDSNLWMDESKSSVLPLDDTPNQWNSEIHRIRNSLLQWERC